MKLSIVYTGDMVVGQAPMEIESDGIGSCVVLVLYDKNKKNGGLAHMMLPTKPENIRHEEELLSAIGVASDYKKARYVNEGVESLVAELEKLGTNKGDLEASVVGGAEMFMEIKKDSKFRIGDENVKATQSKLRELNIPVVMSRVGGEHGRSVKFSLDTGLISVGGQQKDI